MFRIAICFLTVLIICSSTILAQAGNIEGYVYDDQTGTPLIGATALLVENKQGTKTNADGRFEFDRIDAGTYTLKVSYIGYLTFEKKIKIKDQETEFIQVVLEMTGIESKAISVISSRVTSRETPIAISNIAKSDLDERLASRDLPMILNETPGVYASEQGGGSGEARINIRGFKQRNISVLINGVPVNGMENGRVYWSNWNGLGDVTSSIQVQRGLGAAMIANPSVGGTMNIITDAAYQKAGAKFTQEFGSDALLKSTFVVNTGKVDGFAATFSGTKFTGDGTADYTWNDNWGYYLGLSWDISENHMIDLYVMGAPQQHGQRYYRQPAAVWDKEFAKEIGVKQQYIDSEVERGILYNPHWGRYSGEIDPGKEYYNGETHDPRFDNVIMESQNYYHKPQMNLNWFWKIDENVSLTNVFYVSLGTGGSSARSGPTFSKDSSGQIDYDIDMYYNSTNIDDRYNLAEHRSTIILKNLVNNHFWVGWLGTLDMEPIDNLKIQTGLDARYYKGEHWAEVRNLLGGDYYINQIYNYGYKDTTLNQNLLGDSLNYILKLGDKFDFHDDGMVTWLGGFAQGEYRFDDLTTYLNFSLSNTAYQRYDYFKLPGERETVVKSFIGWTVKGGANLKVTDGLNIYGNLGYYNKPPFFNAVFDYDNTAYNPVYNEKIVSFEMGSAFWTRSFKANLNLYYTNWIDRTWPKSFYDNESGITYHYLLRGIDALHEGVELDLNWRPVRDVKLFGSASIGDWFWQNDVQATFSPENNLRLVDTIDVYSKGLKVGDAPHKVFTIGASVYPVRGASITVTYMYFMDHYADFDPAERSEPSDRAQPWRIPDNGKMNLHFGYWLPFDLPFDIRIGGHIFNVLDQIYITDADDSKINEKAHDAGSARIYIGLPRIWRADVQIKFN